MLAADERTHLVARHVAGTHFRHPGLRLPLERRDDRRRDPDDAGRFEKRAAAEADLAAHGAVSEVVAVAMALPSTG